MRAALFATIVAAAVALPTPPVPSSCDGAPNAFPVSTPTPNLTKTFERGTRYSMAGTNVTLLQLRGTPFEMGRQYGALVREEILNVFPEMYAYIDEMIEKALASLPEPIRKAVEEYGVPAALQLTVDVTAPHTPQHWFDLINGMANTTGLNASAIHRLIVFPELIKASCTALGAWGPATASGGVLALRALDFGLGYPLNRFPVLLTFHPEDEAGNAVGHAHSVLSWAGLLGALTGASSSGMGVTEKVWDAYTGLQNIIGYPFHFLMQDILWEDMDTDQALSRVATANRTCAIWLGIADEDNDQFRLLQYSYETVNIYNDKNFPAYPPDHTLFSGVVYVNKHVQPSHNSCVNDLVTYYHGSIDAEALVQTSAIHGTGDLHAAVYDFKGDRFLFSVTTLEPGSNSTWRPAHASPWFAVDTNWLWKQ